MTKGFFSILRRGFSTLDQSTGSLWRAVTTGVDYLRGSDELRKEVTEQYPDPVSARSSDERSPRTRGQLFNDMTKCTGCSDCQKVCPTDCIEVQTEPGHAPGKLWVSTFTIDQSKCVFCGLCVSACLPQSLSHQKRHQSAVTSLSALRLEYGKGLVSLELKELWEKQRIMNERDRSL